MQVDSKPVDGMAPSEFSHYQKVSISLELYASIISRTKEMVIKAFDVKSFFHDNEKRMVLDISRDIFRVSVDEQTLQNMADNLPLPDIETIAVSKPPVPPHEPAPGEDSTSPGVKVAGF